MTLLYLFGSIAFISILVVIFAVSKYYFLPNSIEIDPSVLVAKQCIKFLLKNKVEVGKVTHNHVDIKVLYVKTLSTKPRWLRVEYDDVLEVVK